MISTYWWLTSTLNQGPLIIAINVIMIVCMGMLPIKIQLDAQTGRVMALIILISLWTTWIDGAIMGLITFMMYLPALYLLQLPYEYKKELLEFSTKWYAILLIPALLIYWMTFVTGVPSIGTFVQPGYKPFDNHVFYLETTREFETLRRFNAFFIEPGHQALLSTFLIIANRYRFRECRWLWVLLIAVLFSFSLAGYLLLGLGYLLLNVNTLLKAAVVGTIGAVLFGLASSWAGGDNAVNELILKRLEQDDSKGIKGNNRFNESTDFTFARAARNGELWMGIKDKVNLEIIEGAGFKIYVINYGIIGVILAFLLYLSLVPSDPDYRYTIAYIIILCLCFIQRSYPTWYSWLFPYIIGIYLAKGDKERRLSAE